ncbi:putative tail fiber protein [Achromobacter phage vB_AxyP_19-32_Axy21]|uniref:Putative tail fiber protein n=1 Tax=Achromobacter phage vB_AxyP_19-32_Axy21 TaxID=2591045 RepID=A0A514CVR0_9CAUD|nr:putative tail fiber protein [Achromobacter phage vB_AxyP_19-32_Axy21]
MANSVQRVVSDGTLQRIDLSIKYLQRADIHVIYDGIEVFPPMWQWVQGVSAIEFSRPVDQGIEVLIRRVTRADRAMHVFGRDEMGGNAAFTSETVDTNFRQALMLAQESQEGTLTDLYTDLNMHGYRIRNVGPAVTDADIATLGQIKGQVTAAEAASVSAQSSAAAASGSASRASSSERVMADMFIGIQNRPFPTKNPISGSNLRNGTRLLSAASADNYEEFVWVSGSWVKVSTTVIDGTASYSKAEMDAKLAGLFSGPGQVFKDVTAERNPSTWYTNQTGRPIMLIWFGRVAPNDTGYIQVQMRGGAMGSFNRIVADARVSGSPAYEQLSTGQVIIPPGVSYYFVTARLVADSFQMLSYE